MFIIVTNLDSQLFTEIFTLGVVDSCLRRNDKSGVNRLDDVLD